MLSKTSQKFDSRYVVQSAENQSPGYSGIDKGTSLQLGAWEVLILSASNGPANIHMSV